MTESVEFGKNSDIPETIIASNVDGGDKESLGFRAFMQALEEWVDKSLPLPEEVKGYLGASRPMSSEMVVYRVLYTFLAHGMKIGYFYDFPSEREADDFVVNVLGDKPTWVEIQICPVDREEYLNNL